MTVVMIFLTALCGVYLSWVAVLWLKGFLMPGAHPGIIVLILVYGYVLWNAKEELWEGKEPFWFNLLVPRNSILLL
ncbi:hypothetical protein D7024_05130 [Desulfofundulus salinus]|uniref:Uncharacterized protein n=1 Tax=Desulfofundulus salinus TaxID=2419843 RepID=A0A494WZT8_9FIRM|nr:hypothetical protein D7024_05130 [Desulfofundulus salinum]